jgi:toxin ParE1/3/4
MAEYFLSNKAIEGLKGIWEYTFSTWSEKQADKYYYMLLDACQELAVGRLKGKAYTAIDNETKGIRIGRHIIFYRSIKPSGIEVARILHEQMDLKSRM